MLCPTLPEEEVEGVGTDVPVPPMERPPPLRAPRAPARTGAPQHDSYSRDFYGSQWAQKCTFATHLSHWVQGNETRGRIHLAVSSSYSDTGRIPPRRDISEEVGCTPRTVTTHVATLREAGLLPASRSGNAISIERFPLPLERAHGFHPSSHPTTTGLPAPLPPFSLRA